MKPRKRFGQNFLIDRGIIHAIVEAIRPEADDLVVEIGPGLGALTEPLLQRLNCLHVVEIDRDLILRLKKRYSKLYSPERLIVHEGDALSFDFGALARAVSVQGSTFYEPSPCLWLRRELYQSEGSPSPTRFDTTSRRGNDIAVRKTSPLPLVATPRAGEGSGERADHAMIAFTRKQKIVGNLPYNISTPLLFHLANFAEHVVDMHFMLQKEVVERMVASPNDAAYGRLSVMLQSRFYLESLFDVPPQAFEPSPKVHSALVRMIPKPLEELTIADPECFARLVSAAFGQRRKMLRNTLKPWFDEAGLATLDVSPTARAEELCPDDFARLANALSRSEDAGRDSPFSLAR